MPEIAQLIELAKLKHELQHRLEDPALDFLADFTADEIAVLRHRVIATRHARHEHRFTRIAGLTRMVPMAVSARAAESSLGPLVAARTASAMETADAVRLAQRVSPSFLAEITGYLEPNRSIDVVSMLPEPLLIEVGRELVARDDHLAVGRFVGVLGVRASIAVVQDAPGETILQIALYADDTAALDQIIAALPDETLLRVLSAASEEERARDAVHLLTVVGLESRTRLFDLLPRLDRLQQRRLVQTVIRFQAWHAVLPVLSRISPRALHHLIALPEIADPEVLGRALREEP